MAPTEEMVAELEALNAERLNMLGRAGGGIGGVAEHYTRTLIEYLLDDEEVRECRKRHAEWLAATIDAAEEQMQSEVARRALDISGLFNGKAP